MVTRIFSTTLHILLLLTFCGSVTCQTTNVTATNSSAEVVTSVTPPVLVTSSPMAPTPPPAAANTTTISSTVQPFPSSPTPAVMPLCASNETARCLTDFNTNYVTNGSRPVYNGAITCRNYKGTDAIRTCGDVIKPSCNASQSDNSTHRLYYGLLCTPNGLEIYWFNTTDCEGAMEMNRTMSQLCGVPHNTLNCSESPSASGQVHLMFMSATKTSLLSPLTKNCNKKPTTPAPLKLLPNPVGPEAITAIVVLVCLFITAVLATFFFWPKCHIAKPAAKAVRKVTKQATTAIGGGARATAGGPRAPQGQQLGGGAAAGAEVAYDAHNKTATVKIPPTYGPSAA